MGDWIKSIIKWELIEGKYTKVILTAAWMVWTVASTSLVVLKIFVSAAKNA